LPQSKPDADVEVTVQATSYLGSSVANAPINLVWRTPLEQGRLVRDMALKGGGGGSGEVDAVMWLPREWRYDK
jgi:hypothetical protein